MKADILNAKAKSALDYYMEHPDFKWLFSEYRYQLFYGGRGSGKSHAVAGAMILWAVFAPCKILCAREFQNSIADSVHSLLEWHIDDLGLRDRFLVTKNSIKNQNTKSEFLFKGLKNNVNSIKSLSSVTHCWVEEAASVSEHSWKILLPTIRAPGSRIIMTANPEGEDDFLSRRWITNPCENTKAIRVNYDKNPYFPQELENERQYALNLITSAPNEDARMQAKSDYEHIWEGEFKRILAAQVIRRAEIKEFDTPEFAQLYFGLDFGYSVDPNALTRSFIVGSDLYIDYEVGGRCEIDELPKLLDSVPGVRNWPIFCDAARPETISALRRSGFQASAAKKWQGSVEDGIAYLNSFNRIYIHSRCVETWGETRNYKYKMDPLTGAVLPILVDKHNHYIDSIRYGHHQNINRTGGSFLMQGAYSHPVNAEVNPWSGGEEGGGGGFFT